MVGNILTGKVIGSCQPQHRGRVGQFSLKQLEKSMPPDLEIHLIVDNYSTRFHFSFHPNQQLAQPGGARVRLDYSTNDPSRRFTSGWARWNDEPEPFAWKATVDVILEKVRRCKELTEGRHIRFTTKEREEVLSRRYFAPKVKFVKKLFAIQRMVKGRLR